MNRQEFYAQYRDCRKVLAFALSVERTVDIDVHQLVFEHDFRAFTAACRFGDPLAHPYLRDADGLMRKLYVSRWREPSPLPGGRA